MYSLMVICVLARQKTPYPIGSGGLILQGFRKSLARLESAFSNVGRGGWTVVVNRKAMKVLSHTDLCRWGEGSEIPRAFCWGSRGGKEPYNAHPTLLGVGVDVMVSLPFS